MTVPVRCVCRYDPVYRAPEAIRRSTAVLDSSSSFAAASPASAVSRRRSRRTNAASARTSTTPPRTPISTTARAKSGPVAQQRRGLHRQHHDLLDACQDPDDQERFRDDLVRTQASPHGIEQFDEDEDQQKAVEHLDHDGRGRRVPQPQHGVELRYQQRDRTDDEDHRDRPVDRVLDIPSTRSARRWRSSSAPRRPASPMPPPGVAGHLSGPGNGVSDSVARCEWTAASRTHTTADRGQGARTAGAARGDGPAGEIGTARRQRRGRHCRRAELAAGEEQPRPAAVQDEVGGQQCGVRAGLPAVDSGREGGRAWTPTRRRCPRTGSARRSETPDAAAESSASSRRVPGRLRPAGSPDHRQRR